MKPSRSGHLPVNGLSLYFEVYGELGPAETRPLLLIPGAHMATGLMEAWVAAFAGTRSVIVYDQQGHGRTPDIARKPSYPRFADDAAELLRALKVECADVLGYSQGGGVALQLAIRHAALVGKLVTLSAAYRRDGWYPWVVEFTEPSGTPWWAGTSVEKAFMAHTPDVAAFHAYLKKMREFGREEQTIGDAEMRSISASTMVIAGDSDDVKPEHTMAMFKLLGGGDAEPALSPAGNPATRLVILPTTHAGIFGESAVLAPIVRAFLDDVKPAVPDFF
jgi:pimeloyl-ACP methyl ester carboxylesterase